MHSISSRVHRSARALFTSAQFWLSIILLLSWALRLFHLGSMSLWWDESASYQRAGQDIAGILSGTIPFQKVSIVDGNPPLYFLLLSLATRTFGSTEFSLRMLSVLANVLTVALLYSMVLLLARLVPIRHPRAVGLMTSVLAALSPFYVWYSQEARPYSLFLCLSLLALYALLRMLHADQDRDRVKSRVLAYSIVYGIALAATGLTHYLAALLLPFHAAVLLIFGSRRRRWRALAAALVIVSALLIAGMAAFALHTEAGNFPNPPFVSMFAIFRDVLNSAVAGITARISDVGWLDSALLLLWCAGLVASVYPRLREYRLLLFLLSFVLLPVIALELGSLLRPLYLNSRHLITITPAFYIGLALGIVALWALAIRWTERLFVRSALLALPIASVLLFAGGAWYSLDNLYFNPAYAKDDNRGWAAFLRARARPGDVLILNSPQAETIYRYYGPPGLAWLSLPNLEVEGVERERQDKADIAAALANHPRIWYLELYRSYADAENRVGKLLARGTELNVTRYASTSTEIVLHEIASTSPVLRSPAPIAEPLALRFGKHLQLEGYEAPTQSTAGAHESVKFYWKLRAPEESNLVVSLRLVDEAGTRWAQVDAPPTGELVPVSAWPVGPEILEVHDLPIEPGTPPGQYHLEVVLYDPATGQSLPVGQVDGGESNPVARLGDITVTRPGKPPDPGELALDHHVSLPFGQELALVGYNIDNWQVSPGDQIPLTLYFKLLANAKSDPTGTLVLSPPPWRFWDDAKSEVSFLLSTAGRLPGDIVQVSAVLSIPAGARSGSYSLSLHRNGEDQVLQRLFGLDTFGSLDVR